MRPPISTVAICHQWIRRGLVLGKSPVSSWLRLHAIRHNSSETPSSRVTVANTSYRTDEWMNTPSSILAAVTSQLHLQPNHPLKITRKLIESRFPGYKTHNDLFPVVTTSQNFDSLGFPPDHVGRSRTDTYYLNKETVLRTHTSAHQADVFRANKSEGYLISADVYRRDAIDRSHYPVFHQMEGARTWNRQQVREKGKTLAQAIWDDVAQIPKHDIAIEDPNPPFHPERNPLQASHSPDEVEAIAAHLKRSLEDMVVTIFNSAKMAANVGEPNTDNEPLRVRWVEAYFPFTSPSWELEVFWQGDWLEVLGSGIVSQPILDNAQVPERIGWAFGLGLERIAMLLYSIPDIRLFWSKDPRFLSQFSEQQPIRRFVPFSKYPACFKDVSFWLRSNSNTAGDAAAIHSPSLAGAPQPGPVMSPPTPSATLTPLPSSFHENDVMEIAREVCGDLVEDVRLTDEFVHPKTGRKSMCYRINYRSLERTLTNEETNELHERLGKLLVERLGVELR